MRFCLDAQIRRWLKAGARRGTLPEVGTGMGLFQTLGPGPSTATKIHSPRGQGLGARLEPDSRKALGPHL